MSNQNVFQNSNNAPEAMPVSVIQKIKSLICPPPMQPSTANARIVALNQEIQKQADEIELLEKMVVDLEQRYQLQFSIGQVSVFNSDIVNPTPTLNISGNIPNIALDFALIPPPPGIPGIPGRTGNQGKPGPMGQDGNIGKTGYWGNRG